MNDEKVTVNVVGQIYTHVEDDVVDASASLVLAAEQRINEDGQARAHLTIGNSPDQYQALAMRTDNKDYEGIKARISKDVLDQLYRQMYFLDVACRNLDKLKKHIFYGKPLPEMSAYVPVSPIASERKTAEFELINDKAVDRLHAVLGIATEVGELSSMLHNEVYLSQKDTDVDWIKELGDVAWYLAKGADAVPAQLSNIMDTNVEKLSKRYPDKFTEAAAQTHDGQ